MAAPAAALARLDGERELASAAPGVMLKATLVAPVSPAALAVSV